MRSIRKRAARSTLLTIAALTAFAAAGAGSASAAASMQVTTDTHEVGTLAAVNVKTAISGSGTATRQYGARFSMSSALHLDFYYFGSNSQLCGAGSFSTVNGGLSNVQGFNNASCPDTAKIGTAKLGSMTGTIYAVSASPLPGIGVYFDSGTSQPFGRRLTTSFDEDGGMTALIMGLPNTSTDGLELNFSNPDRAGGLSPKVFEWTEPGTTSCVSNPEVTGTVYTWPWIVWPPFTTYSTTSATADALTLDGCDYSFFTGQDTTQAGDEVGLTTSTGIYGAGAKQYGQTFDLPASIWNNFPGWSVASCSPSSFSTLSTGLFPVAGGFTPTGCQAESVVGTAKLGGQTGSIYIVDSSPMKQYGVYFDHGVAAPYGRRLSLDWGAQGFGRPQLRIFGLDGAANAGLELDFTPPASGQPKIFNLAPAGAEECATDYAKSTIYTYPASGTAATSSGVVTAHYPVYVSGCSS